MAKKILIIGGVAGGATAAARLRRLDEDAQIILFERGEHISFANCGLPYYIGDVITDREKLTLQTPESFNERFNVDVRIKSDVVRINREKKTVTVKRVADSYEYEEAYDNLVLSPGADPIVPPFEGARAEAVFTLRNIPDTYRIKDYVLANNPKRAVVIGAGYIGIEMAENLHALGLAVSIVELMDHVIQPLDTDMAGEIHKHILEKGVGLYLNRGVTAIRQVKHGYDVVLNEGDPIPTDMVIMAVGVRPESSLAKDAGLTLGVRGTIAVDDHMRTSDPAIFAVGDAVEVTDYVNGGKTFVPLASPANRQGRIAADNICGLDSTYKGTQGTAILKAFDMTVAVTGNSEKTLTTAGIPYMKSYTFSGNHAGYYPGASFMTIKLLFAPDTGKVFGAQITGYEGVDKRADVFATAIHAGMTVYDLTNIELAYAPPFGSAKDPVNMAGYAAANLLKGDAKAFYWNDVAGLDKSMVTFLDVRTEEEFANGSIEGASNIPLDDLRTRYSEIDAKKPVYLFCQIGLRGYVASRILKQKGFDVHNLSGGYRFWRMATTKTPPTPPAVSHAPSASQSAKQDEKTMEMSEKAGAHIQSHEQRKLKVDACGLQCPGPILKVHEGITQLDTGDMLTITANDPAFASDVEAWCRRTGNDLLSRDSAKGVITAVIRKGESTSGQKKMSEMTNAKNIIVFSEDLDKAIAAFIIANGAAAMGRKVNMFFTFWGLNLLRKAQKVRVRKNLIETMFGMMMPRGSRRVPLSRMNMLGMGREMIRGVMKHKNISSLEELMTEAMKNGVVITACTMSMDVMGIKMEEMIDGISVGGVAAMLGHAEESDMSLFI